MRWALYVTLSPVWFSPSEVIGQLTPFWILYGLRDALVKPMPGNMQAPCLAESWTVSADQRVYDFKLRGGRSEEHTSELQSQSNLVCRLLLEKKKKYCHPPTPR